MTPPTIVSRDEWLAARLSLLEEEKRLIQMRDAVAETRQALPWVRIEKDYRFEGPNGAVGLADLFGGRSQLIVQHFMFGPGWREGCVGCSFLADHIDGTLVHLANRDVAYIAIARAPYAEIDRFRKRMGWRFPWVSSNDSDFNFDFQVSFTPDQIASGTVRYNFEQSDTSMEDLPGMSTFCRDGDGTVYHTNSVFGRGGEEFVLTDRLLDLTPLGRRLYDENGMSVEWVRHHDRYDQPAGMPEIGVVLAGER
ncbi:MAG: thioredoxin family protein [Pseudomonadota bacterium]|nr:thioredoxin family protein [Pseudomonadota bacterium]